MERERRIAKVVRIVALKDQGNDYQYWKNCSYAERLSALDELRQEFYGYANGPAPRIQKVVRIVRLGED